MRPLLALLACLLAVPLPARAQAAREAGRALSTREQETLVDAFLALDPHDPQSWSEEERILAQLAALPFPNALRMKKWSKHIDKWRRKSAPKLPEKAGEYFDFEEPQRGRYFLAGELKHPEALFVGMHGGGVGSGDAGSAHNSYKQAIGERDWLGIFPEVLEKTECGWTDSGTEEWVLSLVARALDTWEIDPNRVYFGGHSMGGYGSWVLGAHHADRVAALLPSAGAPSPVYGSNGKVISMQKGVVPNLRNVPMCVYQSLDDPKVGPEANQAAVRMVEQARERWGGYEHFEYWQVTGRGHGWPEGGPEALVAKIDAYRRDPHPTAIVWQPGIDWKRSFYWLYWEKPELGATVEAHVDRAAGTIDLELTRSEGAGLWVQLSDAIVDMQRELLVRVGGETVFQGVPEPDFGAWLRSGAYHDPDLQFESRVAVRPR